MSQNDTAQGGSLPTLHLPPLVPRAAALPLHRQGQGVDIFLTTDCWQQHQNQSNLAP